MKSKKILVTLLSAGLLVAVTIGGTLAYMQAQTEKKTNVFTVGEGLSGELKEPEWDGIEFGQTNPPAGADKDATLGKNLAVKFVPGRVIPKDPQVKNTSEGTTAWVAVTIAYENAANSKAAIEKFATIDWNTTDWAFNEDHTVAYYKTAVASEEKTAPLFTKVTIKEEANTKQGDDLEMKNFDIVLDGYLVQQEGFENAETAMKAAYENIFK